jgi:uncharacterized protein (TIGR02453 family)
LIEECGGGMKGGGKIKAIMPAAPSSAFLPPDKIDTPLDHNSMREAGSALGCGVVHLIGEETCIVEEVLKISEFFTASDRRIGGSLMRVYRDTRFIGNGEPYKTNVGIQFRHEFGRDIHAPGFYVHLEPRQCFLAVGLWRPDSAALGQIRQAIVERPIRWHRVRDDKKFRNLFTLEGGSLKKWPRGFPADHPYLEDLKRTDFIAVADLSENEVFQKTFIDKVSQAFTASRPFMRFLCDALKVPF